MIARCQCVWHAPLLLKGPGIQMGVSKRGGPYTYIHIYICNICIYVYIHICICVYMCIHICLFIWRVLHIIEGPYQVPPIFQKLPTSRYLPKTATMISHRNPIPHTFQYLRHLGNVACHQELDSGRGSMQSDMDTR